MNAKDPQEELVAVREIGYYYPEWIWGDPNLIKNLLLFFDQVAILVPSYMRDQPQAVDPALVTGLEDNGLLLVLEPEKLVDAEATELLATAMTDVIASGALDDLGPIGDFAELSMSRMGFYGDEGLAEMVFEELKRRGLARETADGVSIPMHRGVRALYLVVLGQLIPHLAATETRRLHPATDRPDLTGALVDLLDSKPLPSAGQVVSADSDAVGVDLSAFPLDDVLAFREENHEEFKAYARSLRRFVRELASLDEPEREDAMADRLAELQQAGSQLRERSRKAWGKTAGIGLGIAGAAWRASQGDPIGALFAGAAAAAGIASTGSELSSYSYILEAGQRFR